MGRRGSKTDRWREGLGFWLIVLLICVVAGVISYQTGKNWVGRRLAEINLKPGGPQMPPEPKGASELADREEPTAPQPPLTPQVSVEEREPNEAEKEEVKRAAREQQAREEPQNGAQLNAEQEETPSEPDSGEGDFVVTAGSYANSDNARRIAERLTEKGYHPFVTEVEKEGIVYQRVNVAAFDDRSQAEQLRDQLQQEGFVSGVMAR